MNRRKPRVWNFKNGSTIRDNPDTEPMKGFVPPHVYQEDVIGVTLRIPTVKAGMLASTASAAPATGGFRVIITDFRRDKRVKHHVATLTRDGDDLFLRCKCRWKASYASEEILREEHRKHVSGDGDFMSMLKGSSGTSLSDLPSSKDDPG